MQADLFENHTIRAYDFRNPKKFTKEHLSNLNNLSESFTRILASQLSGMLRVFCEVNVARVAEKKYGDFVTAVPEKTFIGIIKITDSSNSDDRESVMLLHVPSVINFFMIDILLGGSGEGCYLEREYTEIEVEILKNFYDKITQYIYDAWSPLVDIKLSPDDYETNPRLIQVLSHDDPVVEVDYEIKLGEMNRSTIRLCIPASCLDEFFVLSNSNQKHNTTRHTSQAEDINRANTIMSALSETELELKAVLGSVELDMQEILSLEKGDIIPIDTKIDDDIIVEVGDIPWFSAKLGELKIKKAVKICDNIKKSASKNYNIKL